MHARGRRQPGQSIVVIALFSMVLFLFVGLGIDSGMLYLERRQLQNAVDAACLAAATELGIGGNSTSATAAGQQYFADNINASAHGAFNMTYPVVGTAILPAVTGQGANITNGIEVDTQDVRVASTLAASTYFLRLGGIDQYAVRARAHCGATAGGGLLPIAVVRFPAYDVKSDRLYGANTTEALPQLYGNGKRRKTMEVRDALRTSSQGILNDGAVSLSSPYLACTSDGSGQWYHWGDGTGGLGNPAANPPTGPYYPPQLMGCAASVSAPGHALELAGNGASASVGSTSFRGPIALDVREIGKAGGPIYYNNWEQLTSSNAKKDRTVDYIKTQYPGPPVEIGQHVGLLSGVNAGNIIDAIQDRYPVGSRVVTVVYNGHVFRLGDFEMSITCVQGNPGCDNNGSNDGRYIERDKPPTSNHPKRSGSICEYSGAYYIADPSYAGFSGVSANLTSPFVPARYTVRLEPVSGSSTNVVKLVARLSGANVGSASHAGAPENFGKFMVRWSWSDTTTTPATPRQTTYAYPDDAAAVASVTLPSSGVTNVTLEVIQTDFGTDVACGPSGGPPSVLMPNRAAGAYSIEVIGTESTSGRSHVAYGLLGMVDPAASGSNKFVTGDHFMAFMNEPVGKVISNDPQTLEIPLELTKADPPTSGGPNRDVYAQNELGTPSSSVVWYKDGTRLSGSPANMSASLLAPNASSGKDPILEIVQSGTVVTGTYDIDLQISGGTPPLQTHSSRYRLIVESDTNASIDEWIVAVCYSEFELLGEGGSLTRPYKSNELWGRATSGCMNKDTLKKSLTSRLLPW